MLKQKCGIIYSVCLIVFLSVSFNNVIAQNIKRSFRLLSKPDYLKVEEQFLKIITDDPEYTAAHFGLVLLYSNDQSGKFDLIRAWEHAIQVKNNLNSLNADDIEVIGEYYLNTETRRSSRPVKSKIERTIAAVEEMLIKYVREENNLELAYAVLEKFPDFKYYNNIVHIRNQLEFRKYEKQHTLEGYLEFIENFPYAAQIVKAIKYRNTLAFEKVERIGTVEAYNNYLMNYPDANEYQAALKARNAVAFQQAKDQNNIEALDAFIEQYPEALEIAEARGLQKKMLYDYAKKIKTLEAFNEFIQKYPEGQQYVDIFNLKSHDLGRKFLQSENIRGQGLLWARTFDNNQHEESAYSFVVNSGNEYVITGKTSGADSSENKIWIIKTDEQGRMIWNTFFSESYHDEIRLTETNAQDDIVMAGYTCRTPDSASWTAWIFMIDSQGKMLWNKSLGKFRLHDMLITGDNTIYLAGSQKDDSLQTHYSIISLNGKGRRIWQRTYTAYGEITKLCLSRKGSLVFCGSHWLGEMAPDGYLLWEDLPEDTVSVLHATNTSDGDYYLVGIRDSTSIDLLQYDQHGKKVSTVILSLPSEAANAVFACVNNELITSWSSDGILHLDYINIPSGTTIKRNKYPSDANPVKIQPDKAGNLLILLSRRDIILLKNSGIRL